MHLHPTLHLRADDALVISAGIHGTGPTASVAFYVGTEGVGVSLQDADPRRLIRRLREALERLESDMLDVELREMAA